MRKKCLRCKGSGVVGVQLEGRLQLRDCFGGTDWEGMTCPTCHGTGDRPRKDALPCPVLEAQLNARIRELQDHA